MTDPAWGGRPNLEDLTEVRRVDVAVDQSTVQALHGVMVAVGVSLTEAVRRTTAIGHFAIRALVRDGDRMFVEGAAGRREVVLLDTPVAGAFAKVGPAGTAQAAAGSAHNEPTGLGAAARYVVSLWNDWPQARRDAVRGLSAHLHDALIALTDTVRAAPAATARERSIRFDPVYGPLADPHDLTYPECPLCGTATAMSGDCVAHGRDDYRREISRLRAALRWLDANDRIEVERHRRRLGKAYGRASRTIAELRGENARLREAHRPSQPSPDQPASAPEGTPS